METETVDHRLIGNIQVLVKKRSKQQDTLLALFQNAWKKIEKPL